MRAITDQSRQYKLTARRCISLWDPWWPASWTFYPVQILIRLTRLQKQIFCQCRFIKRLLHRDDLDKLASKGLFRCACPFCPALRVWLLIYIIYAWSGNRFHLQPDNFHKAKIPLLRIFGFVGCCCEIIFVQVFSSFCKLFWKISNDRWPKSFFEILDDCFIYYHLNFIILLNHKIIMLWVIKTW